MPTTQAAVSLKLKRLEERLGCRLVERTPRSVPLDGAWRELPLRAHSGHPAQPSGVSEADI
jgi:DNA-binding transcriptional LysR family regulator